MDALLGGLTAIALLITLMWLIHRRDGEALGRRIEERIDEIRGQWS